MSDSKKRYRIAIREESGMVNAYWAPIDSMEGAELVACCSREVLDDAPELVDAFYMLMEMASVALCKSRLSVVPRSVEFSAADGLGKGRH